MGGREYRGKQIINRGLAVLGLCRPWSDFSLTSQFAIFTRSGELNMGNACW